MNFLFKNRFIAKKNPPAANKFRKGQSMIKSHVWKK